MPVPNAQFVMGLEMECLTSVPTAPDQNETAAAKLLEVLARSTPSLPAAAGVFTTYGRVYIDVGHVEMASAECDDPFVLTSVVERLQAVIGTALAELHRQGIPLVLANNNHSGLLGTNTSVWAQHENYLVERHPAEFAHRMLPFLVTRIYGGSGGIVFPTGDFVAGVRSLFMELETGGATTGSRAIHSTAREEHHMGPLPHRYRYHLILGDGHRSHYNLALMAGATALATKVAASTDRLLAQDLKLLKAHFPDGAWVAKLREINVLARPGQPLRIHPAVVETQHAYLRAARRYAEQLVDPPAWIERTLEHWQQTLDALARMDRDFLAARLDAFTKYELFTSALADAQLDWVRLPAHGQMFCELALLDQNYHEFCNPNSVFYQLEQAGAIAHRVYPPVAPGAEAEPFVPEVKTRAAARARLIREHAGNRDLIADWSYAIERHTNRRRRLEDPFAAEFSPWESSDPSAANYDAQDLYARDALRRYDQGQFEMAHASIMRVQQLLQVLARPLSRELQIHLAWVQARRGQTDAAEVLASAYRDQPVTLQSAADYCCVYRYAGLTPNWELMQPWMNCGLELLAASGGGTMTSLEGYFRDHAARGLLHHGRIAPALEMLEPAMARGEAFGPRLHARLLCTMGEIERLAGDRRAAQRLLKRAAEHQEQANLDGDLADFTAPGLVKAHLSKRLAQQWLTRAMQVQTHNSNWLGHARSVVLQSRLSGDRQVNANNKALLGTYRERMPALAQCQRMTQILVHWDAWTSGESICDWDEQFWGV